jgi:para-aminobenzoate synthetase component 1
MTLSHHLPLVEELQPAPEATSAWLALCGRPHCLFLDSALRHEALGRYSFVAVDPFEVLRRPVGELDPIGQLGERLGQFPVATVPELPPFQGGAAGLFSYDLNRSLERIPPPRYDEFGLPALLVGLYDVVLAFDHQQRRAWIISQGLPQIEENARRRRAEERLAQLKHWLSEPGWDHGPCNSTNSHPAIRLAPQYPTGRLDDLTSNFSEKDYLAAIRRVVEYIHAGDAFQVNLAQRLLFPAKDDAVSLYRRLRECNPATFAGYFDLGDFQIVSASPERFLRVSGHDVEARPIKGTRQLTSLPEADLFAAEGLRQSEKDRAENVMIVDLLRNDLSRVCRPDSVQVTQLCQLETYQYVQHLVSAVTGRLAEGRTALELVRAAFPGGSITGAPKVRAMEIIAELEPTARGPYCGSLGYVGFDGTMDLSILIRTITAGRGWWQLPVGGGIVAQSHPEDEYEETWHKARGLIQALR